MEISERKPYYSRVWFRAWKETRSVWNLNRWLVLIGGLLYAISSTTLVSVLRNGVRGRVSSRVVVTSALGSAVFGVVIVWVGKVIQSVKFLDDEWVARTDG